SISSRKRQRLKRPRIERGPLCSGLRMGARAMLRCMIVPPYLAAAGKDTESILLIVLVQLCVIIITARVFAVLFRKIGQPAVVGEIMAGLILGPSVFGHFFPEVSAHLFDHSVAPIFPIPSLSGLCFLLFLL